MYCFIVFVHCSQLSETDTFFWTRSNVDLKQKCKHCYHCPLFACRFGHNSQQQKAQWSCNISIIELIFYRVVFGCAVVGFWIILINKLFCINSESISCDFYILTLGAPVLVVKLQQCSFAPALSLHTQQNKRQKNRFKWVFWFYFIYTRKNAENQFLSRNTARHDNTST